MHSSDTNCSFSIIGTCTSLWSRHKCECGVNNIVAADCGPSFKPFTLTENQEMHFSPTKRYRHVTQLGKVTALLNRWKRATEWQGSENDHSLGLSFRTLKLRSTLLSVIGSFGGYTKIELIDGALVYRSRTAGKPEINMTTDISVSDGGWHTIELLVQNDILKFYLDQQRVGYEVVFSAAHNFIAPDIEKYVIGNANPDGHGYRGCIANFTLDSELQSILGSNQLLEANVPSGYTSDGCDVNVFSIGESRDSVDIGVTVVIIFFVLLLCALAGSFAFYKLRQKFNKDAEKGTHHALPTMAPRNNAGVNRGFDMSDERQLNNSRVALTSPKQKKQQQPDVIENESFGMRVRDRVDSPSRPQQLNIPTVGAAMPHLDPDPVYEAEHYDIENASSIAPSDIDIVYHYKGYRDGGANRFGGRGSLPKKKRHAHLNTPLARLSPSSEISRNTPRILTLGDLTGKPLPTALLVEQSERSLNSPVSHISSAIDGRMSHSRGLTSENVAKFNNQRSTPGLDQASHTSGGRATKNSTLVNTLDLVSVGSDGHKKSNYATPPIDVNTSSSSDNEDNDSFTCSEFECESNVGSANPMAASRFNKDMSDVSNGGGMVFSKLMDMGEARKRIRRRNYNSSDATDEDDDYDEPRGRSRPTSTTSTGKSWEQLLTWWPDYESFSGVFKDIAELPHISSLDGDCRPSPVGDHRAVEEEYI